MFKFIHNQNYSKIVVAIILLLIIVWGFILRVYKLGEQSYWIDEGYTVNAVLSTLEKGYPTLDSGQDYRRSILNTYLIAGAVKIGGFNPIATRSVAVIFGTGSILLIYLLGKRFFHELVGLGAAFLISLSYWQIAWSRQSRMYIQLQFFFLLSIYIFLSLLEKFSYKKLIFLIILTGATIFSHFFGYFLLPIYLVVLILKLFTEKKEKIKLYFQDKTRVMIFSGVLIISIIIMVDLIIAFFQQVNKNGYFLGKNYQMFLFTYIPIIFSLAIIGMLLVLLERKRILVSLTLIISYLLPYLVITFSAKTLHYRYLFFLTPLLFLFAVYTLFFISNKFKMQKSLFIGLLIIIIGGSVFISHRFMVFLPQVNYYLESFTPQPNFKKAYEVIKQISFDENKVIISPYTQMDKVYLGKSDYWLAIDLNGGYLNQQLLPEREFYNNAITIKNVEQLKQIIDEQSGYIVVDDMALSIRLERDIIDLIGEQQLIYTDQERYGSRIWVFAF